MLMCLIYWQLTHSTVTAVIVAHILKQHTFGAEKQLTDAHSKRNVM